MVDAPKAKSYYFNQAISDQHITSEEAEGLIGLCVDKDDPTKPIDNQWYKIVQDWYLALEAGQIQSDLGGLTFADEAIEGGPLTECQENHPWAKNFLCSGLKDYLPEARQKMDLFFKSSYPGSLMHYRNELAKNGLSDVDINVEFSQFDAGGDPVLTKAEGEGQEGLYYLDFQFGGNEYTVLLNTKKSFVEQEFSGDNELSSLVSDAIEYLTWEYKNNILGGDEKACFVDAMTGLNGFYVQINSTANPMFKLPSEVQDHGNVTPDYTKLHSIESESPVSIHSDGTYDDQMIKDIMETVTNIIGSELMEFFAENDIVLNFLDFKESQNDNLGADSYNDLTQGYAGLFDYNKGEIHIDTNQGVDYMTITAIHELGHAFNFLIQQSNFVKIPYLDDDIQPALDDTQDSVIVLGEQRDRYLSRPRNMMPSFYGDTNPFECFAEDFTQYMLERAGRFDLIEHNFGRNPYADQSLYVVSPTDYLVISKVVDVVEKRKDDPKSFDLLMANGLTQELYASIENSYVGRQDHASRVYQERVDHPDQSSKFLDSIDKENFRAPIGYHYETDLSAPYARRWAYVQNPTYAERILGDFDRVYEREVQIKYLPELAHLRQEYVDTKNLEKQIDYQAVIIACRMVGAKTREQKVQVLINSGIKSYTDYDNFLNGLTVLDSGDVDQVLNPDELMIDVEARVAELLNRD